MRWIKQGQVFSVGGEAGWMNSHAQVPTVHVMDDRLRIFFSTRPKLDLSLTTFVDVELENPQKIITIRDTPIIALGKPGTFDEHGVMPSCVISRGTKLYLYYSGWSRRVSVPYANMTGLVVSEDAGLTFNRLGDGPILSTTLHEPYSATSPLVLKSGEQWHMWYSSGVDWFKHQNKYEHSYIFKYACSTDGIQWQQTNRSILVEEDKCYAYCRPTIIQLKGRYHMWYSYRGLSNFREGNAGYRIAHAISSDLIHWERQYGVAELFPSESGWDEVMVAYPCVVKVLDRILLFYNGRGFGATGFGYAILEE